jgi:c-di-GMP-binding flagellar brake protein YcgR
MRETEYLTPGLRLKLMAQASIKSKLVAVLVGFRHRRFLVVERPTVGGAPVSMETGTRWLASFLNQGCVFSFATEVLGATHAPFPLVFLEYPERFDETSLRQGKRFPVQISTLIEAHGVPANGDPAKGLIRDLSDGGCQLVTTHAFAVGTMVRLTLALKPDQSLSDLMAEVKSQADLGGRFVLGMSFAPGLTSDSYQVLRRFIEDLRAMPLRFDT